MDTPVRWNTSGSGVSPAVSPPKWKEVQQGIRLVLLGYTVLVVIGAPGVFFLWLSGYPDRVAVSGLGLTPDETAELGWVITGAGALLAYLLVLVGQWRCLGHAPQRHGGKEFIYTSILCLLTAPPCLIAAHYLGGADNYSLLAAGLDRAGLRDFLYGPGPLQVAGVLLGLLSVLCFSGFVHGVCKCMGRPGERRRSFFWLAGFLVGGSVGIFLTPPSAPRSEVFTGLVAGWAICLLWHVALVAAASRLIDITLRHGGRLSGQHRVDAGQKPRPYSGIHRYLQHINVVD